jgi:hypothetical protein
VLAIVTYLFQMSGKIKTKLAYNKINSFFKMVQPAIG